MSTAVPSTPIRPGRSPLKGLSAALWSLPARLVAIFSGTVGLVLKIGFLAVVNAIAAWAAFVLVADEKWIALAVLLAATAAIDAIYLVPGWAIPLKFLVPGTIFLIAFQLVPIVYNVNVGFTNWSTGHILTKSEAIEGIQRNSLSPPEGGRSYLMAPARDADKNLVLILVDEESGARFVGTREELEALERGSVDVSDLGVIASVEGYELIAGNELFELDTEISTFVVPTESGAVRAEGLGAASELAPTLDYDARADTFTRIADGAVFTDNGLGSFVNEAGEEVEPGWRTGVGTRNFRAVLSDPLIREPFVRVFIWTFAFAAAIVFVSFAIGLFLAIVLDKPSLRFRRIYQVLLVVPYALPSFLAVLVWGGLLNDDFGVVNSILNTNIPWLFDEWWAKVSVIAVSVWLTVPYFLLVSLGSLQSIPAELTEAARVDGAGPWGVFRKVTLPMLMIVVAPLMIASFALNFNNFVNIYLLTGGGPPAEDQSIAGSTDILITYTYKLAFEAGKGNDFGLASAVSIFIFLIVATISAIAFWRTKSLENVR
ncbi:MAG: ABC transporter permease subunit [Actinomycetota bacterium]|nr:ABC transporter permease subunit [Actinomycetota bacterium]